MSSPFYTGTVPYQGVDPGFPQFPPTTPAEFWLAKPAAGLLVQMPSPRDNGTYTGAGSRGQVEQALAGGSAAGVRWASKMRRWSWTYERLLGRDFQIAEGVYNWDVLGPGPWCYLPPEDTNRLTRVQSMCGAVNGVVEGWSVSAGTLTYDSTIAPVMEPSGVLRWSGAGSGSVLRASPTSTLDTLHSVPYIPAHPWQFDAWVCTASGTASVRLNLLGKSPDGTTTTDTVNSTAVTVGTSWVRLAIDLVPGQLSSGAAHLLPRIECRTTSAPDLLISCPWLTDRPDDVDDWSVGTGAPRVIWPVAPGRAIGWHMGADVTVTLAECQTGAA